MSNKTSGNENVKAGNSKRELWLKRLMGAAAVASVVVLTEVLWEPLNESAMVLAAPLSEAIYSWAGRTPPDAERMAVVKLDEKRHAKIYDGRQPLNRCALKDDLAQLAKVPGIQTLAIDFDLSPIEDPPSDQKRCQEQLDALLKDPANASRWILMQPGVPQGPVKLVEAIDIWEQGMRRLPIAFADVSVNVKRGWVLDHGPAGASSPAMAVAIDQRLRARPPQEDSHSHGDASYPISYLALTGLFNGGQPLTLDHACLQASGRPAECGQITTLLFGSGYTELDRFDTPMGKFDGVDLHAMLAACPTAGISHFWMFLLEVALGALLAPLFEWGWHRYCRTASGEAIEHAHRTTATWRQRPRLRRWLSMLVPTRPESAYLWILFLGLLALIVMAVVFVLLVAVGALSRCPVMLTPLAIIVGMFIEVSVSQNIEVSSERLAELQKELRRSSRVEAIDFDADALRNPHRVIRITLFLALLTAAVTYLQHYWHWMKLLEWIRS